MNVAIEMPGLAQLRAKFEKFPQQITAKLPEILMGLAVDATALIKNRVFNYGRDVNDQKFDDYSERYKKWKDENAKPGSFKDGVVNLFNTGILSAQTLPSMASSMASMVSVQGNANVYGLAHQIGSRGPVREWLGLTPKERDFITRQFEKSFSVLVMELV
jgi:phage gpG-like protein